jgi:hypothetical protein
VSQVGGGQCRTAQQAVFIQGDQALPLAVELAVSEFPLPLRQGLVGVFIVELLVNP